MNFNYIVKKEKTSNIIRQFFCLILFFKQARKCRSFLQLSATFFTAQKNIPGEQSPYLSNSLLFSTRINQVVLMKSLIIVRENINKLSSITIAFKPKTKVYQKEKGTSNLHLQRVNNCYSGNRL